MTLVHIAGHIEVHVAANDWTVEIPGDGYRPTILGEGRTRRDAITALEAFIRDAQAALAALRDAPTPSQLAAAAAEHNPRPSTPRYTEQRCTCGHNLGTGHTQDALDLHHTALAHQETP